MHAPLPDIYRRPPYRRSWTDASLRFLATLIGQMVMGLPIYLALVASDLVPNEDPDYWRLRILWWSVIVMVILGLRCLAWVVDALVPSQTPHGPVAGYRPIFHS